MKLNIFNRVILILNYFFSFFLLLSYLAPVIDPQSFWLFAFFGLAYPLLLIINVFFLLYWACQFKLYLLISAVSILIGWNMLTNSIGLHFKTHLMAEKPKGQIRIMTYNVHNFQTIDTPFNLSAHQQILSLIHQWQPDVIGFEEFYLNSNQFKICDSLKKMLKTPYYYFEPFTKTDRDSTGLAIFSKFPIVTRKCVQLGDEKNDGECIYVDVQSNHRIFRMYSVHLQSLKFDPSESTYLNSLVHLKTTNLHALSNILSKLKACFQKRSQQVNIFKQNAKQCKYPYIVSGDFNDTPSSYTYSQMANELKNSFSERGSGICNTYIGAPSSFQIDYILTSKQFSVRNYEVVKQKIADHYPVCVDLAMN